MGVKESGMVTLVRREFAVDLPLEMAWQHLARVERWPSWARHIERVEASPPGELGAPSTGVIHLRNGVKSKFTMTEYSPFRHWKWVGRFLWLTVHYDHVFEGLSPRRTKLTWVVGAEGFGVTVLGRLFAKIYRRNLDKAVPLLIEEMNARMNRTEHRTLVRHVWPLLVVQDIGKSVEFYRDLLGFAVVGKAELDGSMFWCRLERGGSSLMLQQAGAEDGPAEKGGRGVTLYFICDDADAMHAELSSRGLRMNPPKLAPYGMKQIFAPEPDGYSICFESPTENWEG